MIPFIEQIIGVSLFTVLAPGIWGLYEISLGNVSYGIISLSVFFVLFIPCAIYLDRHKKIRLLITFPSAMVILLAFWFVFAK